MSDYCRQCSLDHFGVDLGELEGLTKPKDWALDFAVSAICEGCGIILVDPEGNCASDCAEHGKPGHWVKSPGYGSVAYQGFHLRHALKRLWRQCIHALGFRR